MGKIITSFFDDRAIIEFESALKSVLISEKTLKRIQKTLVDLHELLPEGELADRVKSLLDLCHSHLVDRQVEAITDQIQHLTMEKKEITPHKIKTLRKKLDALTNQHALSLENKHLILLAKRLLKRIDPTDQKLLSLPAEAEAGELCFEIGTLLYTNERKKALELWKHLSLSSQKEIAVWVKKAKGSLDEVKELKNLKTARALMERTAQGFLGYALGEIPSAHQMRALFRDMERFD